MKIKSSILAIAAACTFGVLPSTAAVLSAWNFETNITTTPDATLDNSVTGPSVIAESGLFATTGFVAKGVHAGATSDWSTPVGNGTANAYSVNTWTVGDYFEFATASTGYEGITITFDQTGSNTGPRDFKLQYSTNGSSFTDAAGGAYTLVNVGWSAGTAVLTTSYSFDLSAVGVLDDDSSIWLRLTNTSTVSINGATVATGGTGRVDNIQISGTAIIPVPEPASALLGSLGLLGIIRRRR